MADPNPDLLPPTNFAEVDAGVFRSGFPTPANFAFLDSLKLRSILCLCAEPYPESNLNFVKSRGIRLFQFGISGNKEHITDGAKETFMKALVVLIDSRNHPILIHCQHGKHRTGCLVGCFRKLQYWSLSSVHEEYERFAAEKVRTVDLRFIEEFDAKCFSNLSLDILCNPRDEHLILP